MFEMDICHESRKSLLQLHAARRNDRWRERKKWREAEQKNENDMATEKKALINMSYKVDACLGV